MDCVYPPCETGVWRDNGGVCDTDSRCRVTVNVCVCECVCLSMQKCVSTDACMPKCLHVCVFEWKFFECVCVCTGIVHVCVVLLEHTQRHLRRMRAVKWKTSWLTRSRRFHLMPTHQGWLSLFSGRRLQPYIKRISSVKWKSTLQSQAGVNKLDRGFVLYS